MYEGSANAFINVTTTLPPRLYCLAEDRNRDCHITVSASVILDKKEVKCPQGPQISPLVFPGSETYKIDGACGYRITMDTWTSPLKVPIQGTVNQLKDGDKIRQVQIIASVVAAGVEYDSRFVGTVKVSSHTLYLIYTHMYIKLNHTPLSTCVCVECLTYIYCHL